MRAPPRLLVVSCLAFPALTGCRAPAETMTASVAFTGGDTFQLDAPIHAISGADACALEGFDHARRFGLTFPWSRAALHPEHAQPLDDPSGPLRLMVTRPHPTDAGAVLLAQVTQGVAFVTDDADCTLRGTFDAVRLDLTTPGETADKLSPVADGARRGGGRERRSDHARILPGRRRAAVEDGSARRTLTMNKTLYKLET